MSEEDLGIKIGTLEEKFWTDLKEKLESNILNSKRSIIADERLLILCDEKIAEEMLLQDQDE